MSKLRMGLSSIRRSLSHISVLLGNNTSNKVHANLTYVYLSIHISRATLLHDKKKVTLLHKWSSKLHPKYWNQARECKLSYQRKQSDNSQFLQSFFQRGGKSIFNKFSEPIVFLLSIQKEQFYNFFVPQQLVRSSEEKI